MGITIVQKSDLKRPKKNTKIALVLSGGAISGAAFKLGGLMALNSFMLNQKIIDFDIYVGTSAGSIISVYLANGVPVLEVMKSLEGQRGMLDPIRASDLYNFNYKDFVVQPAHLCWDAITLLPETFIRFIASNNFFQKDFRQLFIRMIDKPTYENVESFLKYCFSYNEKYPKRPSLPWHYLPTGIFTTDKFERSNRKNLKNNHLSNDFTELYERTGKAFYIVAMKLDTAERAVFGHDHINHVPISKAIQASMALPLFYKPVTIDGEDYIDGAVVKTTSIDLAFAKGADLVICYNPFRPFNNETYYRRSKGMRGERRITQDGIYAVLNQVARTFLHTRLQHNIELRRKNPDFKGDIILVEPTEYDDKFFDINPIAFWERRKAAKRGFDSVKESISERYDLLKSILNAYGIDTSPQFINPDYNEPLPYLKTMYQNLLI